MLKQIKSDTEYTSKCFLNSIACGLMLKYINRKYPKYRMGKSGAVPYRYKAEFLDHVESDADLRSIKSLGLIGPGEGRLTSLLEMCFARSPVMKLHAVCHDAWGLYHRKTGRSNGYCYGVNSQNMCDHFKKSCLLGHMSGLLYILWNRALFNKELSYLNHTGNNSDNERGQKEEALRQDNRQGTRV